MLKLNKKMILKVVGGAQCLAPHANLPKDGVFGSASQCRNCGTPPDTK